MNGPYRTGVACDCLPRQPSRQHIQNPYFSNRAEAMRHLRAYIDDVHAEYSSRILPLFSHRKDLLLFLSIFFSSLIRFLVLCIHTISDFAHINTWCHWSWINIRAEVGKIGSACVKIIIFVQSFVGICRRETCYAKKWHIEFMVNKRIDIISNTHSILIPFDVIAFTVYICDPASALGVCEKSIFRFKKTFLIHKLSTTVSIVVCFDPMPWVKYRAFVFARSRCSVSRRNRKSIFVQIGKYALVWDVCESWLRNFAMLLIQRKCVCFSYTLPQLSENFHE